MILTDTHCHLDFNIFDLDRDDVIERAVDAGVARILIPGIDLASSRSAIQLAETHELIYAAVGIHPNEAERWDKETNKTLRRLAKSHKVVAIGEIGLDYYRERARHDRQKESFLRQLDLAAEFCLPVIIHNRDATSDMLPILCMWQEQLALTNNPLATRPGVLHSFSGDEFEAKTAMVHNFLIGVDGPITYQKADNLRRVIAMVPVEYILVETDSPFLTPHPFRCKRNEPGYVMYTVEKISELKNLPIEAVAGQTSANAGRIFQW